MAQITHFECTWCYHRWEGAPIKRPLFGGESPDEVIVRREMTSCPECRPLSPRCAGNSHGPYGMYRCRRELAVAEPVPLCETHYKEVTAELSAAHRQNVEQEKAPLHDRIGELVAELRIERARGAVVYYVQRADGTIKVGYSRRFRVRLYELRKEYGELAVLALEPGGRDVELSRHLMFAEHLVEGREWFAPNAELLAHIDALNAAETEAA